MLIDRKETVDAAPTFPEVLKLLEAWLDKHGLRDREGLDRAMWVTDGVSQACLFVPLHFQRYRIKLTN